MHAACTHLSLHQHFALTLPLFGPRLYSPSFVSYCGLKSVTQGPYRSWRSGAWREGELLHQQILSCELQRALTAHGQVSLSVDTKVHTTRWFWKFFYCCCRLRRWNSPTTPCRPSELPPTTTTGTARPRQPP
ncbi:hypothetical protein FOCC_FOCC003876 [Frankliniella occidentalis]|nr:hypothetical protein FOCC_FOCC003876 [Frankliniella occidentalis]